MSTRYDRVTLDFAVEFAGTGRDYVEPTLEQQADPRFLGFLVWFHEIRLAQIRAEMVAQGPGNITLF